MIAKDPKRTGFKATVLTTDTWEPGEPGAVRLLNAETLVMACPGCGRVSAMSVGNPKPAKGPSWLLAGDATKPETVTLSPSINCVGCCGWHGWLRAGIYESC